MIDSTLSISTRHSVLTVATKNQGKAAEFRELLGEAWEVRTLLDTPSAPDVVEDGNTFEENARKKAVEISQLVEGWVLADDSGLEVDALDGAPGVYSARYAGEAKDDEANNQKVIEQLAARPDAARTARFRCVLALARGGVVHAVFDGVVEGRILESPRGERGFGYDPLFLPDGFNLTTAEMTSEQKHAISHRGRAARQAAAWLAQAASESASSSLAS